MIDSENKTKWTVFLHHKKFMDDFIIPKFLASDDRYIKHLGHVLNDCGDTVNFAQCGDCGTKHFRGYFRCKQKFCSNCERTKSLIWIARIMEYLKPIQKDYNYHFLTLTIRSEKDLDSQIKNLEKAWRYMKNGHKTYRKLFKERFIGGIRSLETKQGKGGFGWHAHYHVFLITSKEHKRDIEWLKDAWQLATAGEGKQPYIKTVQANKLINGVIETVKYMTKFDETTLDINKDHLIEMVYALKNKRRVNTFGCMYGLSSKVEDDFNKIEDKEKNLENFICQVCGGTTAELIYRKFEQVKDQFYYDYLEKDHKD